MLKYDSRVLLTKMKLDIQDGHTRIALKEKEIDEDLTPEYHYL